MIGIARAVVTGAFGFVGRAVAERLLARGIGVRTLTNHPERGGPLRGRIEVFPLDFRDRDALARAMEGASVLFNSFWVRFPRAGRTYEGAVDRSRVLFEAARRAGVARIVHTSIANPDERSPLRYYRGKAQVEAALREGGISRAILRPTVFFGRGDVLLNNIGWFVRRFPFFLVPADGRYRVQPVFVGDFADLAVRLAGEEIDVVLDAVGPEVFPFDDFVRAIASALGRKVRLLHVPPALALAATGIAGLALRDVVLTPDEVRGLRGDLLVSRGAPTCPTPLTQRLRENASEVGRRYASEMARHFDRPFS
jgi:NADH dehydrogenase